MILFHSSYSEVYQLDVTQGVCSHIHFGKGATMSRKIRRSRFETSPRFQSPDTRVSKDKLLKVVPLEEAEMHNWPSTPPKKDEAKLAQHAKGLRALLRFLFSWGRRNRG